MNTHERKVINLALQGGGAHGALTWGVLERLLEEERLEIEGITATSAGAMNAAALKCGLLNGGREGARNRLETFWLGVGRFALTSNPVFAWLQAVNPFMAAINQAAPAYLVGEFVSRVASPYDFNPFNIQPLRMLIGDLDFVAIQEETVWPRLFICATNVRTGKIKVFSGQEISTDAVLASACLPTLFQAIEIEDPKTGETEAYWDGGYIGNPALFPLFYETQTRDVLIVHINPIYRDEVPRRAQDILNRINEVSFNSSLLRELRTIEFVKRMIARGALDTEHFTDVLIHSIRDDHFMGELTVATKLQPDRGLLLALRAKGHELADSFLRRHWRDLNERSSVDLRAMFS